MKQYKFIQAFLFTCLYLLYIL